MPHVHCSGAQVALHQVTAVGSITTLAYAQPPATSPTVHGVPPHVPLLAAGCSDGSVHLLSHGLTHSAAGYARSPTSGEGSPSGAPSAAAAGRRAGGGGGRSSVSGAPGSVEKLCVALAADLRAVTALHLAWTSRGAVGECLAPAKGVEVRSTVDMKGVDRHLAHKEVIGNSKPRNSQEANRLGNFLQPPNASSCSAVHMLRHEVVGHASATGSGNHVWVQYQLTWLSTSTPGLGMGSRCPDAASCNASRTLTNLQSTPPPFRPPVSLESE